MLSDHGETWLWIWGNELSIWRSFKPFVTVGRCWIRICWFPYSTPNWWRCGVCSVWIMHFCLSRFLMVYFARSRWRVLWWSSLHWIGLGGCCTRTYLISLQMPCGPLQSVWTYCPKGQCSILFPDFNKMAEAVVLKNRGLSGSVIHTYLAFNTIKGQISFRDCWPLSLLRTFIQVVDKISPHLCPCLLVFLFSGGSIP